MKVLMRLVGIIGLSLSFAFAATNHTTTGTTTTTTTATTATTPTSAKTKAATATSSTKKAKASTSSSTKSTKVSAVQQYQQPKAQYLFVLQAGTAKITRDKGSFILTLKDVDPDLLFFTDRPVRKTGLLDTAAFLEAWSAKNSSFQLDPPHAALIYTELPKDKNTVRDGIDIKLLNPTLVGHRSYSFNLTDLDGTVVSGTYHKVSIIIDYRINN